MKFKILFFILFIYQCSFGQVETTINGDKTSSKKNTYTQFDLVVPLKGNKNRGESYSDGSENNNWFVPDGIGAKFGYGIHYNKWIGISANSGLDFYSSYKLVATPIFTNFRLSPKIGNQSRITLQYGIGKSFAIGRGNLQGTYQKGSIGIETAEGICLFIEGNSHGYKVNNSIDKVYSINVGICLFNF
ncbi:conserved hypothetical protein [Flavobacterium sp. 9AF]|uniref:hypothetical protein n=1 Tax=Flavobacterium sp. 9AF TaxID=2653142 RepID=UPI0012F38233|nr:hypothetical protein [Flavobacterium sp. 9AF]VXB26473.1 conserved hypothetical protein [Flavobacterium sp. 9AF]